MFLLTSLLTGLLAISLTIIGVASAPAANYFWSNWSDGKPKLTVKNGAEGKFDVTWSGDKGNFVIGKGWNPGSNRLVFSLSRFTPLHLRLLSLSSLYLSHASSLTHPVPPSAN